jgi:hypothetical protein
VLPPTAGNCVGSLLSTVFARVRRKWGSRK